MVALPYEGQLMCKAISTKSYGKGHGWVDKGFNGARAMLQSHIIEFLFVGDWSDGFQPNSICLKAG